MRMRVSVQVCVRTGLLLLHGWCLAPLHIEFAQRGGSSHFLAAVKQQGGWVVEREWWQAQYSASQTSTSKYISTLLKSSLP